MSIQSRAAICPACGVPSDLEMANGYECPECRRVTLIHPAAAPRAPERFWLTEISRNGGTVVSERMTESDIEYVRAESVWKSVFDVVSAESYTSVRHLVKALEAEREKQGYGPHIEAKHSGRMNEPNAFD
ncbi:MAG TPA: hypothetical protein VIX17_11600 [Pyrinomonadaceae bacterium]